MRRQQDKGEEGAGMFLERQLPARHRKQAEIMAVSIVHPV
jgi:hypothetical protein